MHTLARCPHDSSHRGALMSDHDEDGELLEHARDALYDLLKSTEPGTGLVLRVKHLSAGLSGRVRIG